jgi:predicted patatin/cPLA2 family phospholipase
MVDPHGGPSNGESPGAIIAAEMLRNLVLLNESIQKSHQLYERLEQKLDDLAGYHETYMCAIDILMEKSEEGKNKFSLSDVIHAMAEASAEVLGEPEDEPGDEDPRVTSIR